MGASSAHGPGGRDEDPARRPGEPDGGASRWEPVITRPDPMTAEEWRAELEREPAGGRIRRSTRPKRTTSIPEALDLTDAELAEIATAARRGAGQFSE